ncbi:MAG TPA: hypothetical protein O0X39_07785 [Methanocorpusculum sp.]|nr:hypothetical protein [Methanocorpusculum sp.]
MPPQEKKESAETPVIATILLVALTIILILLLFFILASMIPDFDSLIPKKTPEYFVVMKADPVTATIKIKNTGPSISSRDYSVKFYVNGRFLENAVITTLNSHEFIPTHHYGVAKIYGAGPKGDTWDANTSGFIDFSDGTFQSGDVLCIEIYLNTDSTLYSSTTYTCP